ncbi:PSD1 and planctomycete cytochrome C domain-containing protein [Aporhodopirellula aestuarii]|uniref:PSD1 and planctomycete cytochrome C domain-containing protein n=1 Tax=Aporhodopirellula aestuarii TaxID=2950107 RepID=A0ABT0U0S5_9BACT|nr:PSD1 and planctomycete cytochrome C domain-containing protein [Aporhodopirellula aestuarii]MCM2370346.1 PSD1 and planctomycete cytochrome C domain-containing protein [Aporhodopirellula aestuarii]
MAASRFSAFLMLVCVSVSAYAETITPEQLKFFEAKIRPVLIRECYGCHSNESGNVRGGLRLDTQELTHIGGSSGPAVVPGDLDESLLYNAIIHEDFVMPPKRKLPQNVIDDFRQWIEMGAPDPRVTNTVEIRSSITDEDIQTARESFWSYQPPVKQSPPEVANTDWPRSDIDRFVLAKLEQADLTPAADAEPYKVLRRICFDLVGLPPTPEQIDAFTDLWQSNPDRAVEYVVNRLLDMDQFGERWGRHWLDVVRYAESTGREVNMTYPHAWRYRDFVIDSFNNDKPFDHFVQQQIAGDLMPAKTDQQWAENLIATTFLAIGPKNVNEQNRVQFAADLVDEQIDATTRVFLGASVACARCHDHKFDAIPQTDYYALAGVFGNMTTYFGNPPSEYGSFNSVQTNRSSSLLLLPVKDPNPFDKRYTKQELKDLEDELKEKLEELSSVRRTANDGDVANAQRMRIRLSNEMSTISNKLSVVDENGMPRSYCMGVQEREQPSNARLLVRGEIDQPAQSIQRGFPQVLCSTQPSIKSRESGRLQLARWIGSEENPLTARVMVNRIWQHLIGQGIVTSTDDFGITGQSPSHEELLDYLAVRFMQSNWSTKSLIRDIVTSRIYRMDTAYDQHAHEFDPDNALLWRANPRRLDAEAIRDAMLNISGEIDFNRPRGSAVAEAGYTRVTAGVLGNPRDIARKAIESATRNFRGMQRGARNRIAETVARQVTGQLDQEDSKHRSVYLAIVRDEEPRSLSVFDFADSSAIIGTRESSNTANQALYMMNNEFVIQQSAAFADRVIRERTSPNDRLEYAFILAYGRPPTPSERSAAASFIKEFSSSLGYRSRGEETIDALCQSLFASAEFRYLD